MQKAGSIEELFSLVWRKVDPESGKMREEVAVLNQMKEYRAQMKQQSFESQVLLQLFLNSKNTIKP